MAPEIVASIATNQEKQQYGKQVDMWSAGVIIHEMMSGSQLFVGNYTKSVASDILKFGSYFKKWEKCKIIKPDNLPQNITIDIRRFISYYSTWQNINSEKVAIFIDKFLKFNPSERIKAEQALEELEVLQNDLELKQKYQEKIQYEINKRYNEVELILKEYQEFIKPPNKSNDQMDIEQFQFQQIEQDYFNINDLKCALADSDIDFPNINQKLTSFIQKKYSILQLAKNQQNTQNYQNQQYDSQINYQQEQIQQLKQQIQNQEQIFIQKQKQIEHYEVQNSILEEIIKELEKEKMFLKEYVLIDNQTKKNYNSQQQEQNLNSLQLYNEQLLLEINQILKQTKIDYKFDHQIFQGVNQFTFQPIQSKMNDQVKGIIESNRNYDSCLLQHYSNDQNGNQQITIYKTYKKQKQNPQVFEDILANLFKYKNMLQQNPSKNLIPIYEIQANKTVLDININVFNSLRQIAQEINYFSVGFFYQQTTLEDYIKSQKNQPTHHLDKNTIKQKLRIIEQIVYGIQSMHNNEIYHCNLNSKNIFYNPKENKIQISFYSIHEASTSKISKLDMSYFENSYMAPEQHKGLQNCKQNDIWSLGALFHYILTYSSLFQSNSFTKEIVLSYNSNYFMLWQQCSDYRSQNNPNQSFSKHIQKASEMLYKIPDQQIATLISNMLNPDYISRPNINEVAQRFNEIQKRYEEG